MNSLTLVTLLRNICIPFFSYDVELCMDDIKHSGSIVPATHPFPSLRRCLHGVDDPGLVGLVSFVFTLWGTQNKRNLPTRPGSPTPCKQGLSREYK